MHFQVGFSVSTTPARYTPVLCFTLTHPRHHSSPVFLRGLTFRISITVSSNQMMFAFRLWHTYTRGSIPWKEEARKADSERFDLSLITDPVSVGVTTHSTYCFFMRVICIWAWESSNSLPLKCKHTHTRSSMLQYFSRLWTLSRCVSTCAYLKGIKEFCA